MSSISHRRFPLFTKIVFGFVVIIAFMVAASFTVLYQLKPVFSPEHPEFNILPLTHDLEILLDQEEKAAGKFFETRDNFDASTLAVITGQFRLGLKSLHEAVDRDDARAMAEGIITGHERYVEVVESEIARVKKEPSTDGAAILNGLKPATDSLQRQLHSIAEAYIPSLDKELKKMAPRADDAVSTGYIILMLALVVATISAFFLARTFTRPIQALMAGTEKVGEGQYETVQVSSNDEIADLTHAFNLMSEKLKQLDELRVQLMSEISHEMRTPLQVIKAGCYSIGHTKDGPPLTDRQRDAVAMIHQATNRINQFVNSFLDIAKLEAGLMKFNFEELNLADVLTPLVQEAQLVGQTRQINVKTEFEDIPPVTFDRERMGTVVTNLLSNALKYTPKDGSITIRLAKESQCGEAAKNGRGCIRIDVRDTGVGIPEADLQKLFSKFYQAKNTPLTNEKGSGLGLALVKHVAEAHGGRVSVTSTIGVGSTFSILLPA